MSYVLVSSISFIREEVHKFTFRKSVLKRERIDCLNPQEWQCGCAFCFVEWKKFKALKRIFHGILWWHCSILSYSCSCVSGRIIVCISEWCGSASLIFYFFSLWSVLSRGIFAIWTIVCIVHICIEIFFSLKSEICIGSLLIIALHGVKSSIKE